MESSNVLYKEKCSSVYIVGMMNKVWSQNKCQDNGCVGMDKG